MGIIKRIKNFFKGGEKLQDNDFFTQNTLLALYDEFIASDKFRWFEIGDRYYKGENDILSRQMYSVKNGCRVIDTQQPNNHLNHNFTKCIVDQKVDYSLGKPPKLTSSDENYLKSLEKILTDNKFNYNLNILGKKASNEGISYLHPYIDETGEFKFIVVPAKQVIPIWANDMETELDGVIRAYDTTSILNGQIYQYSILEYWSKTGMNKYKIEGNALTPFDNNFDELEEVSGVNNGEVPHAILNGQAFAWGIVPFIPFKNNIDLYPDIRYMKNLIDNYDLTRSDLSNSLEQLRNFILVIKNAQGTELDEIIANLKLYGIIKTDNIDGSGSDVDMLSNPIDCAASQQHTQTLKENIIELMQGVNLNLDFNAPPSGVALQLLYSALDIKANGFETEFRQGFDLLQEFINIYLINKKLITTKCNADIEFIRNIPVNTTEQIQQAKDSSGIISNKTIFEHHPFVKDSNEEEKRFNKENQVYNNHFDKVNGLEGDNFA